MNEHNYPKEWEEVGECFWRMKVPGGWITSISPGNQHRIFVLDINHEWKIKE